MSSIKTLGPVPQIELMARCLDCWVEHRIVTPPGTPFLREMDEWQNKHWGHRIEFVTPKRDIPRDLDDSSFEACGEAPWWLNFKPNANIKVAYGSSVAMTFTSVNSLSSDSNLLAGASALAVDNTGGLYLDYMFAGLVKNNISSNPTAGKEIDIYIYRALDDTPTYPDTLLGTDATKTITTTNILNGFGKIAASLGIAATSGQINPFDAGAVSSYFGGVTPKLWSSFVTHNSGQSLAGSGNTFSYHPVYATSV